MWIDANDCEKKFHEFKRVDGRITCVHTDDSECEEAEYDVTELVEVI